MKKYCGTDFTKTQPLIVIGLADRTESNISYALPQIFRDLRQSVFSLIGTFLCGCKKAQ